MTSCSLAHFRPPLFPAAALVLCEASPQSEWVMTELRKARKAEGQSGQRKLFPVRLADFATLRDWACCDADSGKDLATELREYLIPDFSHGKEHDPFEAAFVRLLKDLRAEERAKGRRAFPCAPHEGVRGLLRRFPPGISAGL